MKVELNDLVKLFFKKKHSHLWVLFFLGQIFNNKLKILCDNNTIENT